MAARLLAFTMIAGYWFSRVPKSWEVRVGLEQVKMPQFAALTQLWPLFS